MKLISHRGNLEGPNPTRENSIDYINEAIELGFDVEIDVWFNDNKWFLGHDEPQQEIEFEFLQNEKLWCHAKNIRALFGLKNRNIEKFFWHETDKFTLTSNGYFWTYPGNPITQFSILVLPELTKFKEVKAEDLGGLYGICSDYIKKYKKI